MESSAALNRIVGLHEKNVGIHYLVSDDNNMMRAHLRHIGTHKYGKLPLGVPMSVFLCDTSHRTPILWALYVLQTDGHTK